RDPAGRVSLLTFSLHPRIEADSVRVGALPLCEVRLHRDGRYPWVVLVPRRPDIREIHELALADRRQLMDESCAVAEAMQRLFSADKMNVAALGNLVPQLHVHSVARFVGDDAWPAPIWGAHPMRPYDDAARSARVAALA